MKNYSNEFLGAVASVVSRHPVRAGFSLLSICFGIFMAFACFKLNGDASVDQLFLYEMAAIGALGTFVGARMIGRLLTDPTRLNA